MLCKKFSVLITLLWLLLSQVRLLEAQATSNNSSLAAVYKADQAGHKERPIDWRAEHVRHERVREMLDKGEVHTATDYYRAASVFEFGSTPDEALLSHVLASDAVALGSQDARWFSAFTLDRYLRVIWEPQVYGTHYQFTPGASVAEMYPIQQNVASDSMRAALCVAPRKGPGASPERLETGRDAESVTRIPCRTSASRVTDSAEITELYKNDQADRKGSTADWQVIANRDLSRQAEAQRMLAAGLVQSGADYYHVAMLFQHGQRPDEYLLAHVLALTAMSRGQVDARWLAAATLDRYLRSTWRPQVFGTQFGSTSWSTDYLQQDFNSSLVSDTARAVLCVVPLKEQATIAAEATAGKPFRSTHLEPCG